MPRLTAEARVAQMQWSTLWPCYVAKVTKKGRTDDQLLAVVEWLTGYGPDETRRLATTDYTLAEFFAHAPRLNPLADTIKGRICGVRIEEIADPLYRQVRVLDKLVDELAKGKSLDRICPAE